MTSSKLAYGDRVGPERRHPQLLCLAPGRTGTISLKRALEQLGYHPYHGEEALKRGDFPQLSKAQKVKTGGSSSSMMDWKEFFQGYDCIINDATVSFTSELIAAFPRAKVILTIRDVEEWITSIDSTLGHILAWRTWKYILWAEPKQVEPLMTWVIDCQPYPGLKDHSRDKLKQYYLKHNETVRQLVSNERLLEYKIQDGWKPLCDFLGFDVPEEDFPNINDSRSFRKNFATMWWIVLMMATGKTVLPVAVVVAASFYYYRMM